MRQAPEKLILEPTTRCNFKCEMCVKQSKGCDIAEGDLDNDAFSRCESLFPSLKSVIFTGIGEPLLNENLETYISRTRDLMPQKSIRGFQTNGKLLTRNRALSLFKAGINKICISVDTIRPGLFDAVRNGGTLSDINQAFDAVKYAKKMFPQTNVKIGIEFVLMKKNMEELPLLVEWAGKRQVDFIIVTHVVAYEKHMEKEIAFLNNSHEALALYETFKQKAKIKEISLAQYYQALWKVNKSKKEIEIYKMAGKLKKEGLKQDLYINLFHILSEPSGEYGRIRTVFDQAATIAHKQGIELTLPSIRPKTKRECCFIEDGSMFVSWDGNVSPCYFLWHKYTVMRMGYIKHVTPVFFGNVHTVSPEEIWNKDEFKKFRTKVAQYDYPNCHAWCETRCDYVLDEPFHQDCYINDIPCCDCHWNLGLLNCLA
ncbi:MAG: radical SAM/SPASM family putative metalloenzyme maturase [Desulfobacula sp.]|uniref:radical SAM/SPASM family putative metalloenzyme maturase n=1 Tax=Desulfobacula sp. TaxID=2593537 RepID=UPI001DEF2E3F|nr:radical SAM/SPASM family putative metalloenzyme maturase [Desulfobacula sp.]MBT3484000.1 radical SAM/SPASM family putative metalloenzyme maturase [Desulfobacula sp.]MBT3803813.1 radical SAM/SPASM family putative metalloenzyme maturase [Desulfobacula sp.]MBT4023758.1 radical SAM/SPASM family putative metalloenzyme maturase [Desulfobacula sp.]MBT4197682.1 radical SAM/SPASM family putative metalloenzyme maturase [Desulfobacula sp.]